MVFLLSQGMSYRAIAGELGVARTTVMRMAAEAARFSGYTDCFINIPLLATRFETNETGRGVGMSGWRGGSSRWSARLLG